MAADPSRHILFCGTSGAGKSTVGLLVARALGREFVDVDRRVERRAGATVATIFARRGEAVFRDLERQTIRDAMGSPAPLVIALGGGALENDDTLADALRHTLVWLKVPVETLVARVAPNGDRPLLAGDPAVRLRELSAAREPRYRRAHVVVDAALAPKGVAASVLDALSRHAEPAGERV